MSFHTSFTTITNHTTSINLAYNPFSNQIFILRFLYVGASSMFISDGGYGEKVLAERERLKQAAALKVAVIRSKVL